MSEGEDVDRKWEGRDQFQRELTALINKHSIENGSNTPDFILAAYLMSCLEDFEDVVKDRDSWYGIAPKPGWTRP